MTIKIDAYGDKLVARFPYNEIDVHKARALPDYRTWSKEADGWIFRASRVNIEYVERIWSSAVWTDGAKKIKGNSEAKQDRYKELAKAKQGEIDVSPLNHVPFKYPPMGHQKIGLMLGRDMDAFAYLMEAGTGKTKLLIDDAAHNFRENRIDALLVIAPNSVKTSWAAWPHMLEQGDMDALDTHMPPDVEFIKGLWISQEKKEDRKCWTKFEQEINKRGNRMIVLTVNVDALNVARCYDFLMKFCDTFRTMMAIDESTRIAKPGTKRTKAAMKLRKLCVKARILTGTPSRQLAAERLFAIQLPRSRHLGIWIVLQLQESLRGAWRLQEQASSVLQKPGRASAEDCILFLSCAEERLP